MATCAFRSPLAPHLQAFFEARGGGYTSFKILRYLDRFLMGELKPGDTITRELTERWFKSMDQVSSGTRINRMSVLRQFCRYLSHFDPRTCIVHRSFVPRRNRPRPYIYSRDEVLRIMAAAKWVRSRDPLRPLVFSTLIGLLYSAGLRIGEALKLTLEDVDLKQGLILVRLTKFKKTRYVPLSPSTTEQLTAYLGERRRAGFSQSPGAPFFVSATGSRYHASTFAATFLEIIRKLGIRGPRGQRGARIHDFRHSFAVSRLVAWYRSGANLSAKLPTLSTYLGHTTVSGTEVYLHATAELLQSVGKRFHEHYAVPPPARRKHAPN
jgi:integrase